MLFSKVVDTNSKVVLKKTYLRVKAKERDSKNLRGREAKL